MKLLCNKWPSTACAKIDVVARWAVMGIFLGGVAYVLLWQFMEPSGQPPGAGFAFVNLFISPWAWTVLAMSALSMALIPVMAIYRGTETTYCRSLKFLENIWIGGLLIAEMLAVFVYHRALRAHDLDGTVIELFTLSVPALLTLFVSFFGLFVEEG